MRLGIYSQLSSNKVFSMDLKRVETLHSLFWDFWTDKTFTTSWSDCRVQVWVQVLDPACHLAITGTLEGYSRRHAKVLSQLLTANQWPSSLAHSLAFLNLGQQLVQFEMKFWMELARSCCQPNLSPLLGSIFQSFIGLCIKRGYMNKTACSQWNPVQRSRS